MTQPTTSSSTDAFEGALAARWGRWLGGVLALLAAAMLLASVFIPLDLARQVPITGPDGSPIGTKVEIVERVPTAILDEPFASDEGRVLAGLAAAALFVGLAALAALLLSGRWRGPVWVSLGLTYALVLAALLGVVAAQPVVALDAARGVALLVLLGGVWGLCVAPGLVLLRVRRGRAAAFGGTMALALLVLATVTHEWGLAAIMLPALVASALTWFKPTWRHRVVALYGASLALLLLGTVVATAGAEVWPDRWLHWRIALGTLGALLLAATGAAQWLLTTVAHHPRATTRAHV